jgi:hypothetical protein
MAHDGLHYGGVFLLIHVEGRNRVTSQNMETDPFNFLTVPIVGDAVSYSDDTNPDRNRGGGNLLTSMDPLRRCRPFSFSEGKMKSSLSAYIGSRRQRALWIWGRRG